VKYLRRKIKKAQRLLTYLFRNSAFFMQSQMDIHPESIWHGKNFFASTRGFFLKGDNQERTMEALEPWDNTRRDMIVLLLRTILEKKIEGDFVEVGVYRGSTARLIHKYAPERKLHLFDTFDGFPEQSIHADGEKANNIVTNKLFRDTTLEAVKKRISSANNNVHFYQGYFPETVPENFGDKQFALVHLDADLYQPTFDGLEFFYPRLSRGGLLLIHDYNGWIGARKAVDDFFAEKPEIPIPMPDKSGSVLVQIQIR